MTAASYDRTPGTVLVRVYGSAHAIQLSRDTTVCDSGGAVDPSRISQPSASAHLVYPQERHRPIKRDQPITPAVCPGSVYRTVLTSRGSRIRSVVCQGHTVLDTAVQVPVSRRTYIESRFFQQA